MVFQAKLGEVFVEIEVVNLDDLMNASSDDLVFVAINDEYLSVRKGDLFDWSVKEV